MQAQKTKMKMKDEHTKIKKNEQTGKKRFGTRIHRTEILNVNVTRRVHVHHAVDGLVVHGLRLHRLHTWSKTRNAQTPVT